ncbi:LysR family transcriptional regulator [Pusillimonas sp.]|uniref:LysR family transcriptional regulator n=1 Tax=Pusillimonas sp. TaxID=3040095 RepID=UPI0029A4B87A|nr:LysR family transcriptional regulator [Pusillimonas sp.]MDX3894140.1 LysR family transcriptional regulator [Pusillimonas sp.]
MAHSKLDLYDFLLLREIRAARSVTGASEQIGLSQPAVSTRLSRLRDHFDDPLFVRTSEGMMATPFLEKLLPHIEQAINLLNPEGGSYKPFDADTSSRRFRLGLSHVAQLVMFPEIVAALRQSAPLVQLDSVDLDPLTGNLLESGKLDLAIGYTIDLHHGFYQQRLFAENYSCIARADHPRISKALTRRQFLQEQHLALVAPTTGHSRLDKALEERGVQRKVAVRVSSFLGLERIITSTDLLAIVPSRLARTLALGGRILPLELPFPSLSYEVRQYWHERYHHDAGNSWMRKLIFDMFTNLPPAFTYQADGRTGSPDPASAPG